MPPRTIAPRRIPVAAQARATLEAACPKVERRFARHDESGLLAALGYHAGHREPMPKDRRRAILR